MRIGWSNSSMRGLDVRDASELACGEGLWLACGTAGSARDGACREARAKGLRPAHGRAARWALGVALTAALVLGAAPSAALAATAELTSEDIAELVNSVDLSQLDLTSTDSSGNDASGTTSAYAYRGDAATLADDSSTYPRAYDLRSYTTESGETVNAVTSVKFQNPWGTCWAFGTIAASETSLYTDLLNAGKLSASTTKTNPLDLSERQLAWFGNSAINDESSSQNGEGSYLGSALLSNSMRLMGGGTYTLATSLLSSGVGPVSEEDVPYRGVNSEGTSTIVKDGNGNDYYYSDADDWSVDEKWHFVTAADLEETYVIPNPTTKNADGSYSTDMRSINAVKEQLMAGRAVATSFKADQSNPTDTTANAKYISTKWAHYTYDGAKASHAVTIVGWDDGYAKENFAEGFEDKALHTPKGDGAFIVKNSWGSADEEFPNKNSWGIGGTGYFYLSYYDTSIACLETFDYDVSTIDFSSSGSGPSGVAYVDGYDYLNDESDSSLGGTASQTSMANVFTAEAKQKVNAVSCITTAPNTQVTYDIYVFDEGVKQDSITNPTAGTKVAGFTRTYELGGYHREKFSGASDVEPFTVSEGQCYSIVVTQHCLDDGQYYFNAARSYTKAERDLLVADARAEEEKNHTLYDAIYQVTFDSYVNTYKTNHPDATEEEAKAMVEEVFNKPEIKSMIDAAIDARVEKQIQQTKILYAVGVVNEYESFLLSDGTWSDWTVYTSAHTGNGSWSDWETSEQATDEATTTWDNFSIRGYAVPFFEVSDSTGYVTNFETLQDAVDFAATCEGDVTVTLGDDVKLSDTLTFPEHEGTITLDLAGHTIIAPKFETYKATIVVQGDVVITDSGETPGALVLSQTVQVGKVASYVDIKPDVDVVASLELAGVAVSYEDVVAINPDDKEATTDAEKTSSTGISVGAGSSLVVGSSASGRETSITLGSEENHAVYSVGVVTSGSVTIESGSINVYGTKQAIAVASEVDEQSGAGDPSVTIAGGTLDAHASGTEGSAIGIQANAGNVAVSSGKVYAASYGEVDSGNFRSIALSMNNASATISGGSVVGDFFGIYDTCNVEGREFSLDISGGTVAATNEEHFGVAVRVADYAGSIAVNVTGGELTGPFAALISDFESDGKSMISISGGTFTGGLALSQVMYDNQGYPRYGDPTSEHFRVTGGTFYFDESYGSREGLAQALASGYSLSEIPEGDAAYKAGYCGYRAVPASPEVNPGGGADGSGTGADANTGANDGSSSTPSSPRRGRGSMPRTGDSSSLVSIVSGALAACTLAAGIVIRRRS